MRSTLSVLLLVLVAGCSVPQYGVQIRNDTPAPLTDLSIKWRHWNNDYSLTATKLDPGAALHATVQLDGIPKEITAIHRVNEKLETIVVPVPRAPLRDSDVLVTFRPGGPPVATIVEKRSPSP